MTYTRSQVRDLVRRRLGDLTPPYTFSDLQLNQWIVDAIADYTNTFPRRLTATIDTTAGTNEYDLPSDFLSMLSVESPSGESPPRYLLRLDRRSAAFLGGEGYYDLFEPGDAGAVPQLCLSGDIQNGEASIIYQAQHAYLDDDADECSLPDPHLELIVLFCRWAANQELASTESADPDPKSLAMSTLELNAYRAERAYRQSLKDYQRGAESGRGEWNGEVERVY
jgi:hypothetical protein